MKRCRTCVLPDTRPDTHFDDTGQCSACTSYQRRPMIDWAERKAQLLQLLDRHRGECLVPSSGGKDSHFQVLTLIELGAKVTIITASTCLLTEIGRRNIDNLARYAQTIEVTPNRSVRAKLNRIGLELVGDPSWPEHASIWAVPFRVACRIGVPLMMYGESPQEAYGGPQGSHEARQMTRRWTQELGGLNGIRPSDFVGRDGITEHDMHPYVMPSEQEIVDAGVEAHFLGQYIGPWDSHHNARIAADAGMQWCLPSKANWWPFENADGILVGVHDFFMLLKYGFGRATAQLSVDVRAGRIHREEALLLARERDGLFPIEYMGEPLDNVLTHIGMSRDQFMDCCNAFMNRDLFVEQSIGWGQVLTLKEFA